MSGCSVLRPGNNRSMHSRTNSRPPVFTDIAISVKEDFDHRGFTLIEFLVALTIFAAILAMLYPSYTGTFHNIETAESESETYQMARIALERMSEDLQSAYIPEKAEAPENGGDSTLSAAFLGQDSTLDGRDADRLQFFSEAHISLKGNDSNGRARIVYYLKKMEGEDALVLYRSDTLELEDQPEEETGGFVLCDRLYSIDFTFYDENGETHDFWDSSIEPFVNKLPLMVTIRLKAAKKSENGPPISFMTSVSLPLARNRYVKGS